jgi:phosphate-selective porin OprO/OprP
MCLGYRLLFIVLFISILPYSVAQAQDPMSVVIKNIHLINQEGLEADVLVNILITDKQLEVVTQDDISSEIAEIIINGMDGFLLGTLEIGAAPSFVIVNKDPRGSLQILMDTKAYVQFAVEEGVIILNKLQEITAPLPEYEKAARSGWLAYDPPPLALPLSYRNNRKWNKFNSKYVNGILIGGVLLDRSYWLSQDGASEQQVGDLSEYDGGEIRALRVGLAGTLNFNTPWIYTIFGATNAFDKGFDSDETDDLSWLDYRLDIPVFENTTLSIGKQKEPISLERITGLTFIPMQERTAAADGLLPSRNHGILLNGMRSDGWMTWAAGTFNNWIDTGKSFDEESSQLIGRMSWVPLVSSDESNLLHLGFGLRHSDAKQEIRYRTTPETNLSPVFVDTGLLKANSALTYNFETYWRKGPYWLGLEYLRSDVNSPEHGSPRFDGYHISTSWVISGEQRAYRKRSGTFDPIIVAKSVAQGGWGTWEGSFRYSNLDLTNGSIDGGELDVYSLGLNWWLSQTAQFSLNYRYSTLYQGGIEGDSSVITSRILLLLN